MATGNGFRRYTFAVVEQGDGRWLAYEEDKDGPANKVEKVPAVAEKNPYRAIALLCESVALTSS